MSHRSIALLFRFPHVHNVLQFEFVWPKHLSNFTKGFCFSFGGYRVGRWDVGGVSDLLRVANWLHASLFGALKTHLLQETKHARNTERLEPPDPQRLC